MSNSVKIQSITKLAHNWGRFDDYLVSHPRTDGTSQTIRREVYDHGSAAAVLLYAAGARTVVLTRQFRLPPHLNGDPAWLIEVPAGLLDGEAPDLAARREAIEESGYEPTNLQFMFDAYMSPGSVTEKCACYIGHYAPGQKVSAGGGLPSEGEDIEVLELGFDTALAMIATGEVVDAKTIMLLQALALKLANAR